MATPPWQLSLPIPAIIFDCDGTLSEIEGIDELARNNAVYASVQALTEEAMSKTGINPEMYQERMRLVKPHYQQVMALGQYYFDRQTPEATSVIQLFKNHNKIIYLISAGINPAVTIFGKLLGIDSKNIFAVDVRFDAAGHYIDFDHTSTLTHRYGKRDIVSKLKTLHPEILYIGDGMNDIAAADLVTRFIGYGGKNYRENIANRCDFYIKTFSLAPLLPLALTQEECNSLTSTEYALYQQGLTAIMTKQVQINENKFANK